MKLIVGLGNPGQQYENTRHNAGFLVLETLINTDKTQVNTDKIRDNPFLDLCKSVSDWKFGKKSECEEATVKMKNGETLFLAQPQTMMNASGRAVRKLLSFYKVAPQDLLVVHDDLDLKLGEFKLQLAKGPKVHNGVNSIEQSLGTGDFWRLRVGVDNRNLNNRRTGEEYVLESFPAGEKSVLTILIHDRLLGEISAWLHATP